MRTSSWVGVVVAWIACGCVAACAAGGAPDGSGSDTPDSSASSAKDAGSTKKDAQSSSSNDAAQSTGTEDAGSTDAQMGDEPDAQTAPQPIVFGHSPDTLYSMDVTTNQITEVAPFSGCTQSTLTQVIDLAIDAHMNAYVTTFDGFYSLDLGTAQCTLVKTGAYPNSLSFVPAGTVDPNVEALVGYAGNAYLRIDTSTGDITSVGTLSGGYQSSGDIVSVEGGGTFLTVTGNGCGDCLLQVNPATGDLVQSYGALPHGAVYGLAYWAGSLYGFDATGDLFTIGSDGDGGIASTDVVTDGGVIWWGAGSTTIAPSTAADGGAIPTQ